MKNFFIHADLDAFFASVEILDHPEWKNLPVIVGGKQEDRRAVVSTASYEARKYGVHSAMPTAIASRLCPNGIFVHPRMKRYLEMSGKIMEIFSRYSPDVQQISIDEAFIDLTGTEKLFGPPDETAKKIKDDVKKETGLTVSIGLAPTKYLAKLASEIKKPDGFFEVKEGNEENFMLSLPLKKIWGIGEKTLALLNKNGINTTEDLHSKPKNLLAALFGQVTGTFLYDAVRGQEKETFNQTPKTHTISAENTYPFDLTSKEAIETALLELSYTVIWRMRKENLRSWTIGLKIRYENFTTTTVQETSTREISSIDDLFERAKKLFDKKADTSKGIRLLGLALQNTESASNPHQAELFNFDEEKKRKVEEAVLKAEKKIPGIKITKARLLGKDSLKSIVFFVIPSVFFIFSTQKIFSSPLTSTQTERNADGAGSIVFNSTLLPPQTEESDEIPLKEKKSLFNYSIFDKNVDFFAEGYWKSLVNGGFSSSFGFGSTPALSLSTPVVLSEVNLSLFFLLEKHWYFEADFADHFDKNTVAAGYYGDGILKNARISNRGIVFESGYSIDDLNRSPGGGENLAPGISAHFETQTLSADAILRYDSLEAKSKTWYGKNSVFEQKIELSDYETGFQFVLPSRQAVLAVKSVFIENSDGNYKDENGRTFKKLNSSQFLLSASNYSIFLSKEAKAYKISGTLPAVAVEYDSSYPASVALSELGTYGEAGEKNGSGFLGEVQDNFSKNLKNYSLSQTGKIDGNEVFYIQYPKKFSPYAVCYRYDAGLLSSGEAAVCSGSTSVQNENFFVTLGENDFSDVLTDFFNSSHIYADVFSKNSNSPLSAEYRFPFCSEAEEIYLGLKPSSDLKVCVRSFTPVNRFEIGTDASGGTVLVYKNGIQDAGAAYDKESGCITLSTSVSASDKITAQWYEDSPDSSSGAITAAGGIKKQFTKNLSGDFAFAGSWTLPNTDSEKNYTTLTTSSPGHAVFATGLEYSAENFKFKNTGAVSLESSNTTGKCLISGMDEEKTETFYLAKDAAVSIPDDILPVLTPRPGKSERKIELKGSKNGSIEAKNGQSDSSITGYSASFEWDFSNFSENAAESSPFWAGTSLKFPALSGILPSCGEFSLALKIDENSDFFSLSDFELYLQLGVNADENLSFEDKNQIPTWKIGSSEGQCDPDVKIAFNKEKKGEWQTVTVKISDEEKSLLATDCGGRLILTSKSKKAGRIFAGPYEAKESGFFVSTENGSDYEVFTAREKAGSSNYMTFFKFNNSSEETFTLTRYFGEINLEGYKFLRLNTKFSSKNLICDDETFLILTFDRPQSDGSFKTAVKIKLSAEDLAKLSQTQKFSDIKINLSEKKSNYGSVEKIDVSVVPTRFCAEFHSASQTELAFDSFMLTDSSPYFLLQDIVKTSWQKNGELIKIKDYAILKDASFQADGRTCSQINNSNSENKNHFSGSAKTSFTFSEIYFSIDAGRSADSSMPLSSASHTVKNAKPFFKILNIEENYSFNHDDESLKKSNSLLADFSPLNFPFVFSADATADSDIWAQNQNISAKLHLKTRPFVFEMQSGAKQKIISTNSGETKYYNTKNYFDSWNKITSLEFSPGKTEAAKRNVFAKANLKFNLEKNNFSPEYNFYSEESYKNSAYITYSDKTSQTFSVPFSIKKNNFSFSWKKSTGGTQKTDKNENYSDDFEQLASTLNKKIWYFKALPFYDIFSSSIKNEVLKDPMMDEESTENIYYTSLYSAAWKRNFFGNSKDFFLPQNASLSFERDIKTSSSVTDVCQLKGILGFSALNVFGKNSAIHLTDLFEQDEYLTSFSLTLKIPGQNFSSSVAVISFYQQDIFYIKKDETLKAGFEFSFEDKNNLSAKSTLVWKRPGESSLIEKFFVYFFRRFELFSAQKTQSQTKINRSDSLNAVFSRTRSSSTTGTTVSEHNFFEYLHALDIQLNKFVCINSSLGLSYSCYWNKNASLSASAQIGATIKF